MGVIAGCLACLGPPFRKSDNCLFALQPEPGTHWGSGPWLRPVGAHSIYDAVNEQVQENIILKKPKKDN